MIEVLICHLPQKSADRVTSWVPPVPLHAELEPVFALVPVHVVAQRVDVLEVKRRHRRTGCKRFVCAGAVFPSDTDVTERLSRYDRRTCLCVDTRTVIPGPSERQPENVQH